MPFVHDDSGMKLDAEFLLEGGDIILKSSGGGNRSSKPVNTDYREGLRLVLQRLGTHNAVQLHEVLVDSSVARKLPVNERTIFGPKESTADTAGLMRLLAKRMASVGRAPGAKSSGNTTKRLRFRTLFEGDSRLLERLISHGDVIETEYSRSTNLIPEEIAPSEDYAEGAVVRILVNRYERNPRARAACIAWYGTRCTVCDEDMAEKYGPVATGLIHVHHVTSLAERGKEYAVDPVADLRPVCPNCHAVIHIRKVPFSIEDARALLQK